MASGPDMALMIVKGTGGPPSLDEAARQLGTSRDALDESFGVIPIDPDRGLYSVRVRAGKVKGGVKYSDPPIEPFGLD